jgi:hypothetical protein
MKESSWINAESVMVTNELSMNPSANCDLYYIPLKTADCGMKLAQHCAGHSDDKFGNVWPYVPSQQPFYVDVILS